MKMVNNFYQKHKERLWKEACERYSNISEKEKEKGEKRLEKDIKILLEKKKKRGINIMWNIRRSYLAIEEIII